VSVACVSCRIVSADGRTATIEAAGPPGPTRLRAETTLPETFDESFACAK
jgi:hypothetical protein